MPDAGSFGARMFTVACNSIKESPAFAALAAGVAARGLDEANEKNQSIRRIL